MYTEAYIVEKDPIRERPGVIVCVVWTVSTVYHERVPPNCPKQWHAAGNTEIPLIAGRKCLTANQPNPIHDEG